MGISLEERGAYLMRTARGRFLVQEARTVGILEVLGALSTLTEGEARQLVRTYDSTRTSRGWFFLR